MDVGMLVREMDLERLKLPPGRTQNILEDGEKTRGMATVSMMTE